MWLLVHIKNLPQDSRFYAEKRGGQQFRGWDPQTYATAAMVNSIRALQFVYVASHSKKMPKPPDPFPIPEKTLKTKPAPKPGSFAYIVASQLAAKKRKEGGG